MPTAFHTLVTPNDPEIFTCFNALVSDAPGHYPGVLIIEIGPAKGHFVVKEDNGKVVNYDRFDEGHAKLQKYPLYIGEETLDDVVQCGNDSIITKCKLDHGSTVRDLVGEYAAFRREGNQVRADLTLLNSSPHRAYVEEIISKMSKKIGNSIDFDYQYEIKNGKAIARCERLNSVDIVDSPAATNSLFSEKEKTQTNTDMPLNDDDLAKLGKMMDEKISGQLGTVKSEFSNQFAALNKKLEEGEGKKEDKEDEDKKKKEDEEEDKKEQLREAKMKTLLLSTFKEVMPQAALHNLNPGQQFKQGEDEYAEKLKLCAEAGITGGRAIKHIASKWPAIYNAKFGAGSAQKTQL